MNAEFLRFARARQLLRRALNSYFDARDYIEIEAPILVPMPGTEVHLGYFATQWQDGRDRKHPAFLRSSPELHLKQALSFGLERVWHLAKCFRNGGEWADWHHPEFTMLEWYQSGIGYQDFMAATEALVRHLAAELSQAGLATLPTWPATFSRLTVKEAFARYARIELLDGDPNLARLARAQGIQSVRADDDFETAFFKVQLECIEPALAKLKAVFLCDYPPSQAALARVENGVAQRFELYLNGIEICNAFSELTDPRENHRRLVDSGRRRAELGLTPIELDTDFMAALERGIPSCCGNALGFDRLLAILLGEDNLKSVIPFREMLPYRAND